MILKNSIYSLKSFLNPLLFKHKKRRLNTRLNVFFCMHPFD
mgnify:CR=1 FL=1